MLVNHNVGMLTLTKNYNHHTHIKPQADLSKKFSDLNT